MRSVAAFAALYTSEYECSNSVSAWMSAVAQICNARRVDAERKPIECRRRSLGRDVAMQHNAITSCNTSSNVEKEENVGEGKYCTALGANVLMQSMHCGALLSTLAMCCCSAGLRKFCPLVSSVSQCHCAFKFHYEKFGTFAANEAGHVALQIGIDFLGGRVLNIFDQLGRCVHGRSFHGLANKVLLVDGKLSGTVVFVLNNSMFRVNAARNLLNFCFTRTSTALNNGT